MITFEDLVENNSSANEEDSITTVTVAGLEVVNTTIDQATDGQALLVGGKLKKKNGTKLDMLDTQDNPIIIGSITEQVGTMTTAIDATLGTIQTLTMTADTTLTDNLSDGQYLYLEVTNAGWTLLYPQIVWLDGKEPLLNTEDCILFYKTQNTLKGVYIGKIS